LKFALNIPLKQNAISRAAATPRRGPLRIPIAPLIIAVLVLAPIVLVAAELITPSVDVWIHLWRTLLPEMLVNTVLLLAGVTAMSLVLGVSLAWLTAMHRFPGSRVFDWLLILPMAMPGYVLGFIYMATFDYAGPTQTLLRDLFGSSKWFPNIRSLGGAIIVLSLVLYPYVYVLARAAFRDQSAVLLESARMLGCSRLGAMWRVALPMARPALVAGATLVMMEALTDFATVRYFNVITLSEGVVRVWQGMMDRQAATELASLLLFMALGIVLIERKLRGSAKYHHVGSRIAEPLQLRGMKAALATMMCAGVLLAAFALPAAQLVAWAIADLKTSDGTTQLIFMQYVMNTLELAALAALVAVTLAVVLAFSARAVYGRRRNPAARVLSRLATLGYAMPGAVVAVGVLLVLSSIDKALGLGLLLTGSILGLIYAYVVRFMAVSFNSVESSMETVQPAMEMAARSLGASPLQALRHVYVPLMRGGVLAGAILVFVDAMKELPATMLLRPLGMDTLAIWAYGLAAESFWQQAALPSLTILLAGLIPVILFARVSRQR
jgi:iron(III) transport system permease protein